MADTQNVLDQMTAGIMQQKANKSTKLTPVAGEAVSSLPKTPAAFPNDQPQEVTEGIIRDIEIQIVRLQEVVTALRLLTGAVESTDEGPTLTPVSATLKVDKEAEAKADENVAFTANYARLQAEAQAAVFKDAPPTVAPLAKGWECPVHGGTSLQSLTSRKGRMYKACTQCEEFER